jgi:hypothetical protein
MYCESNFYVRATFSVYKANFIKNPNLSNLKNLKRLNLYQDTKLY